MSDMLVTDKNQMTERRREGEKDQKCQMVNKRVDILHNDSGTKGLQKWWG